MPMIRALHPVLKRTNYPLEGMLVRVRWYAAYSLSLRHFASAPSAGLPKPGPGRSAKAVAVSASAATRSLDYLGVHRVRAWRSRSIALETAVEEQSNRPKASIGRAFRPVFATADQLCPSGKSA